MRSRFPGIDPYIEQRRWPDFHNRLIVALSDTLLNSVSERYSAVIEERVYVEYASEQPAKLIERDVTVPAVPSGRKSSMLPANSSAPVMVPFLIPERHREPYLELRLHESGELVAVIEVLSPANKRSGSEGRREYLAKRAIVQQSSAHLIELDLLRTGHPLPMAAPLPEAYGHIIVSRVELRPLCEVWPVELRAPLPTFEVPVAAPDADVALNLQTIFDQVFESARYARALDYNSRLQPPLSDDDARWVADLLREP